MALADLHGSLVAVTQRNMGDFASATASIGATTVTLTDVSDFDEAGGSVLIGGNVYSYDAADMNAETIHLTTTLSTAVAIGDEIDLYDADNSVIVSEQVALVAVDDQDGDPINAPLDYALSAQVPEGTLAAGQSVSLTRDGVGYRVTAVHGKNQQVISRSTTTSGQVGIDDGAGNVYGIIISPGGSTVRVGTLVDCRVKTPDGATYKPILASAFTVSSDASLKTKPTKAPDALAIIKAAPATHWRYLTDDKSVKRVGPMAGDLPEWLQQPDSEDGTLGLDLARQSGLHHRAIEQLLARVEALESELADLKKER